MQNGSRIDYCVHFPLACTNAAIDAYSPKNRIKGKRIADDSRTAVLDIGKDMDNLERPLQTGKDTGKRTDITSMKAKMFRYSLNAPGLPRANGDKTFGLRLVNDDSPAFISITGKNQHVKITECLANLILWQQAKKANAIMPCEFFQLGAERTIANQSQRAHPT